MRRTAWPHKTIRRTHHLRRRFTRAELERIGPQEERQRAILRLVVASRQIDGGRQLHPIGPHVRDQLARDTREHRRRVGELRDGPRRDLAHEIAHEIVRRIGLRLATRERHGAIGIEHADGLLEVRRDALEHARLGGRREVEAIHERTITFRSGTESGQKRHLLVGRGEQHRLPARVARGEEVARVGVAIFTRALPQQPRRLGPRRVDNPRARLPCLAFSLARDRQSCCAPRDGTGTPARFQECFRRSGERRLE